MMGAYTAATATGFNSLDKAKIIVLNEAPKEINSTLRQKKTYSDKTVSTDTGVTFH